MKLFSVVTVVPLLVSSVVLAQSPPPTAPSATRPRPVETPPPSTSFRSSESYEAPAPSTTAPQGSFQGSYSRDSHSGTWSPVSTSFKGTYSRSPRSGS